MTTKSKIARALRRAAAEMERHGYAGVISAPFPGPITEEFTCNIVGFAGNTATTDDAHGYVRRHEYAELFDMDSDYQQSVLWNINKRDPKLTTRDLRVLMLGFAAAMVETGDLTA